MPDVMRPEGDDNTVGISETGGARDGAERAAVGATRADAGARAALLERVSRRVWRLAAVERHRSRDPRVRPHALHALRHSHPRPNDGDPRRIAHAGGAASAFRRLLPAAPGGRPAARPARVADLFVVDVDERAERGDLR